MQMRMLIDIFELMSIEEIDYILRYFERLASQPERIALSHYHYSQQIDVKAKDSVTERLLKRQLITDDPEILKLLDGGIEQLRATVAKNLIENYPAEVFLNKCKICGKLVRTPQAKQCRFCGYDWH